MLCIGAILKTKSTPAMSKPVCIRGSGIHDKNVMIRFSCYLCKTKVYSFKTYILIHFVSFDEYYQCFFNFWFVFGHLRREIMAEPT